jgi:hypothetical protein
MKNITPVFPIQKINMSQLCNGDKDLPLKFEFYSFHEGENDKLYGSCLTSINKLRDTKSYELFNKDKRGGEMIVNEFDIVVKNNFVEYLRSGWAVNMACAIDYTGSNKRIESKDSLHF